MTAHYQWATVVLFLAGATALASDSEAVTTVALLIAVGCVVWFGLAALAEAVPGRPTPGTDAPVGPAIARRYALAFRSHLTFEGMIEALQQEASWACHLRFKDAWGDYLFVRMRPAPYNAVAAVLADGDRYIANVKLSGDVPGGAAEFKEAERRLLEVLSARLGATRITNTEYWE